MMARRLLFAGLIATTIGTFLPWSYSGDFINRSEAGVRVFPIFLFSEHARWLVPGVEDHGGVLILILNLALGIALMLPKAVERLRLWTVAGATVLLLLPLLHMMNLIIKGAKWGATTGGPTVGVGLLLVFLGSALVMAAVLKLRAHRPPLPGSHRS